MSHSQKEMVVFNRAIGLSTSIASGLTSWVSLIETILAVGDYCMPLIIHRGKLPRTPLDIWFRCTKSTPNWL